MQRTKQENLNTTSLVSHKIPQLFHKEDADKLLSVLNQFYLEHNIIEKFEEETKEEEIIPLKGVLKTMQVINLIGGIIQQCLSSKFSKKLTLEDYEKIVVFALLWGVSGSYELNARKIFEDMLRDKASNALPNLKEGENMFDYFLHLGERGLEWRLILPEKWKPPKEIFFSRLLMPTMDSTRSHILIDMMNVNN